MKRRVQRVEEAVRRAAGEDREGNRILVRVVRVITTSLSPGGEVSVTEREIEVRGNR